MKLVVQRVRQASVEVAGECVGQIKQGLLVLACVESDDSEQTAQRAAQKLSKLRVFADEQGKTNLSVIDIEGQILLVSQFTLAANMKGNRPGFGSAAAPEIAQPLFERLAENLKALGVEPQTGVFGADMQVNLINDGPATYWLEF